MDKMMGDLYTLLEGPPKRTFLEVFMVKNLFFFGGQNLYFSWLWEILAGSLNLDLRRTFDAPKKVPNIFSQR